MYNLKHKTSQNISVANIALTGVQKHQTLDLEISMTSLSQNSPMFSKLDNACYCCPQIGNALLLYLKKATFVLLKLIIIHSLDYVYRSFLIKPC